MELFKSSKLWLKNIDFQPDRLLITIFNLKFMQDFPKTDRNKVKRVPKRGHYDKATVYKILDAGFVCHVGFVANGQPFVIPTAYGRRGDVLYFHGATTSRLIQDLSKGLPVCVAVTHLDGLVMSRSTFDHSMNYRSVVVFGTAHLVPDKDKNEALFVVSEHIAPGRWDEVRPPSAKELKATAVLSLKIKEASAKIRTGPPKDNPTDYALPVWAGVLPIQMQIGEPEDDPLLRPGIAVQASVKNYNKDRFK